MRMTCRFISRCVFLLLGSAPCRHSDLSLLRLQLLQYNEAPLFLQFSPTNARMAEATASGDLPLSIYESIVEIVKGETRHFFVPAGYRIDTGEAERIAVDHVSKQSAPGADHDGAGTRES